MNLIPVFNKTLPRAHMELELDVFGVPGKLVKYVVTRQKEKIDFFFSLHTSSPNCNRPVFGFKEF
jgi:hypothetical protein